MSSKIYDGALTFAIFLIINACAAAAAGNEDDGHFTSLRIVGSVFCDTCFRQQFSKSSYFISDASVAVECRNNTQKTEKPDFRIEAKTNEHGQFEVELPLSMFYSRKEGKRCSATLLPNSAEGPCKVASVAKSSSFFLKSKQGGVYTYSAGFFSYRPQSPPPSCSEDSVHTANNPDSDVKGSAPLESSKTFIIPPFLSPFFPSPPPPPPPCLLFLPPFKLPPLPFLPSPPPPPPPFLPFLPPFNLPPLPFLPPIPPAQHILPSTLPELTPALAPMHSNP